ncbi:ubinuclein-2a isoform 1-T1 [Clarias gariepinus]
MAEPRKVPFVTLPGLSAAAAPSSEAKRRRVDADSEASPSLEPGLGAPEAAGPGRESGREPGQSRTVRISITLPESTEHSAPEYSYSDLLRVKKKKKKNPPSVTQPDDPFSDEQRQKQEVEALARKFEEKYGSGCRKKREDRVQDLIDIGFGYDESDSFIDNSEAYDELVPASLNTKLGGFYINTGTLQFRTASESESDDAEGHAHSMGDEESEMKRKRRREEVELKKMKSNRLVKTARPEKKRRKKLMLAAMLRRFAHEKKEMCELNPSSSTQLLHGDALLGDLTSDPAMMSLLTSTSESDLQDLLSDLEFSVLDAAPQTQLAENGLMYAGEGLRAGAGASLSQEAELGCPPPLPEGLPAPLIKRIEDLRVASRQFDEEGRKKFFTLDMNNILLDIELQVQERAPSVRSAVYSHLEAFVPCNKEALLKRLKKLSLNIQDDRLRAPLLKLKWAVCSVMPEQTARYNMDCMAKVAAKQQLDDGERNGSEDEEEEKPGKRVMGPRKKFIWDDKLRTLLCTLVRMKLRCYEQEKSSLSVEDYLKAFMENEVKPLWPKGWMQARMLLKESRTVHGHLTEPGKKRIISTPRPAKVKETGWQLGTLPAVSPAPFPTCPPPEPICLSDSLDEDLATSSLDSIAQALTLLNNSAKGMNPNSTPSTTSSSSSSSPPVVASPAPSSQSSTPKDISSVQRHAVAPASRPSNATTNPTPAAKPRPPPTTTPLQKPFGAMGTKPGQATPPTAVMKTASNRLYDNGTQQPNLTSINPKNFQQLATPPPPSTSVFQRKATPTGHHQQRFITPMQATITKSSQSSNSPIIKLTHRSSAQITPPVSAHRSSAQTTPPVSAHRSSAQTTPPVSAHRSSAQTTLPVSAHRSSAQTTPPVSTHRTSAQATPSGSAHLTPAQATPSGSPHRPLVQTTPPAQTMPSASTHRTPALATPSGPLAQTMSPGSAHRSPVSTPSPPVSSHHPAITPPSPLPLSHSNHPSASNPQNLGPTHRSTALTLPPSGSTHRSSASTPPSASSHRPPLQTPSGSAFRPPVPTPPPNLAHRSPVATSPSVSSPAPSSSRPLVSTPPTQYGPKSSGFKSPFGPSPVATPSSFQDCNLTSSSLTTNHGQRQRAGGGASQSNKSSANCASAMGLPSLSDSALLNQVASMPLGLGMFGGLVPVSLPFQFPLLNFAPPGAATHTSSSGYTLTPNLFKSLQSGVQAALPPHLQLAFSESNQSQGGDVKRK